MPYVYYNTNPEKRKTTDCVIRAVSFALDETWEETFIHIAVECLASHDMPEANYIWAKYLTERGFERILIPNTCPNCHTVKDFCSDHSEGTYILGTGMHAVAVRDGDYYDIFDSGDEVPIYYWRRKER